MNSTMRVFYLYIVSLISLIMFASGIVSCVYNCSKYVFPDDSAFFESESNTDNSYINSSNRDYAAQRRNYKKSTIKNLVVSILITVIGLLLHKYHWKTIETERVQLEN